MRFELEVTLGEIVYAYVIAFEFPPGFKELRVLEEKFVAGGNAVYTRELAQVRLARAGREAEAKFLIDWHLVALPLVQEQSTTDPLSICKRWLARMLILRPMPSLVAGDSNEETLQPDVHVKNFGGKRNLWAGMLLLG